MKSRFFLAVCLLTATILLACTPYKPHTTEGDHSLGVVISEAHSKLLKKQIEKSLERPIATPQPEPQFWLEFGTADSLEKYSAWHNVLMVATLDSKDSVSAKVQRMLKGDVLDGVSRGEYVIFRKLDLWAKPQTVVFLVSPTANDLAIWLAENSSELFNTYKSIRDERTIKQMFALMEQDDLSDSLRNAHGWSIRIQHDYQLVSSSRSPDYVRLRRTLPDRFLTVAWRLGEAEEVSLGTLLSWKNEIGGQFEDPIKVNEAYVSKFETTIQGRNTVGCYALWETIGPLGGGPSISYLLHSGDTLYLLDGQVFAPDREKEIFLRQLRLMCESFEPPME